MMSHTSISNHGYDHKSSTQPWPQGIAATASPAVPLSSHAVCRSDEFLSCAKTALKLAKRQRSSQAQHHDHLLQKNDDVNGNNWWLVPLDELRLNNIQMDGLAPIPCLEDALDLLRGMNDEIVTLEGLVRRRGNTNDPTVEIQRCTQRLERDTQALSASLKEMIPSSARGQHLRHWQNITQWFQSVAQEQAKRFQEVLKTRGRVLAEQAHRRKLYSSSTSAGVTPSTAGAPGLGSHSVSLSGARGYQDNPLFRIKAPAMTRTTDEQRMGGPSAMTHSINGGSNNQQQRNSPVSQSNKSALTAANAQYPTYSGVTHQVGYGGRRANAGTHLSNRNNMNHRNDDHFASMPFHDTGMRQRRPPGMAATWSDAASTEAQTQLLQWRQQERLSEQRLQEARQAERNLTELGTLFGKMSNLLSAQSEIIDKVEDDVEAAHLDVASGHGEIQTLYSIKKGNRALILKVFGLLIFFIVFMRFYKSK